MTRLPLELYEQLLWGFPEQTLKGKGRRPGETHREGELESPAFQQSGPDRQPSSIPDWQQEKDNAPCKHTKKEVGSTVLTFHTL